MPTTKHRIAQTLAEILKRKPFDSITIKELVDECNISRQAFYYHFQDIFDVIEWSLNEKIQETLTLSITRSNAKEGCSDFIQTVYDNRIILLQLLDSKYYQQVQRLLFTSVFVMSYAVYCI